jgi:hypothetical protein
MVTVAVMMRMKGVCEGGIRGESGGEEEGVGVKVKVR